MRINIKPLSVNDAWQGKRFKSPKYKSYEKELLFKLPNKIDLPDGKLKVSYIVGYSNPASDIDNFIKSFQDVLQKKYGFNDSKIYKLEVEKVIVAKGCEFIDFNIENMLLNI